VQRRLVEVPPGIPLGVAHRAVSGELWRMLSACAPAIEDRPHIVSGPHVVINDTQSFSVQDSILSSQLTVNSSQLTRLATPHTTLAVVVTIARRRRRHAVSARFISLRLVSHGLARHVKTLGLDSLI